MPAWTDDRCLTMDKTNSLVHEAKILDERMFYRIFDTLQKGFLIC